MVGDDDALPTSLRVLGVNAAQWLRVALLGREDGHSDHASRLKHMLRVAQLTGARFANRVGIGVRVAGDATARTHLVESARLRSQTRFEVPRTFPERQLREYRH